MQGGPSNISNSNNTFSISPALPNGVSLDANTGTISGTIFSRPSQPTFTITIAGNSTYSTPSGSTQITLLTNDVDATGTVTISGTVEEGGTVTADTSGLTDIDGGITQYSYQWRITDNTGSFIDINGETSSSYTISSQQSVVGKYLQVKVTTTDQYGGTTDFFSAPTGYFIANVNDNPTGSVYIYNVSTQIQ